MVALKGTRGGAEWHLAASLADLFAEVAKRWPDRPAGSDGTIGDAAHAARASEHNPDKGGVVRALDVTRLDQDMADAFIDAVKADPRAWYVIHRGYIWSRTHDWEPRHYDGPNPHQDHLHVSVRAGLVGAKAGPWGLLAEPVKPKPAKVPPTLSRGVNRGVGTELVATLQRFLGVRESGFADRTKLAVIRYQRQHDLKPDGVVGPLTWAVILTALKLPGYNA